MNIPTYVKQESQELYNEILNDAMQQCLSDNGWTVPQITAANLASIYASMPDGTIWYVTDSTPPEFVGKINGSLYKFSVTAYP